MLGVITGVFIALTSDLPQIRRLESYQPPAITRIYSSDNELLDEWYIEKRDAVSIHEIPDDLKNGIISTEDRQFYHHFGISIKGIIRAAVKNIVLGKYAEGASTITQQLAKTLFLTPQKTITRKIKEAFLAFQIERRYTKDEILSLYLNQIYFGSGAYGVKAASNLYFGKPLKDLSIAECALLAGIPKAPSRYSPFVQLSIAIKRRNIVLKQMALLGYIKSDQYEKALNEPLTLATRQTQHKKATYFLDYAKKQLEELIEPHTLYQSGYIIYTTLNAAYQRFAEQAVQEGLHQLEQRMKHRSIVGRPQAALIAIHIQSGNIISMVGGRNFTESNFNRAIMAYRQPGSAFKPIIFAYAIENGLTQNSVLLDAPVEYDFGNGKIWRPNNYSGKYKGEISLRYALVKSLNIPAIRLLEQLQPEHVIQFSQKLGIYSDLKANLSLALGTSELTLLELTSAYAVFPNQGQWIQPMCIKSIYNQNERLVFKTKPEKKIVMTKESAAIITNMLMAVIQEGTGKKAKHIDLQLGGKTGTTDDFKDALFIGFSPEIAVGVWVGMDDNTSLGHGETGAQAALPIWIKFIKNLVNDHTQKQFKIPDTTQFQGIHYQTGKPLPQDNKNSVQALFLRGRNVFNSTF